MKTWRNISDFADLVVVTFLSAPDQFPQEDFLPPEKQMNLGRAFAELSVRLDCAAKELDSQFVVEARHVLDDTLTLYRSGATKEAALKLQRLLYHPLLDLLRERQRAEIAAHNGPKL